MTNCSFNSIITGKRPITDFCDFMKFFVSPLTINEWTFILKVPSVMLKDCLDTK